MRVMAEYSQTAMLSAATAVAESEARAKVLLEALRELEAAVIAVHGPEFKQHITSLCVRRLRSQVIEARYVIETEGRQS